MNLAAQGIYAILNTESGKVYIGSTACSFKRRWGRHRSWLRKGNHTNPHLQAAWDKYGKTAFEFGILEYLSNPKEIHLAEQFWMDVYREEGRELYNCGLVAANPMLGRPVPEEVRRKISEALAGRPCLEETRRRLAKPYPAFFNTETGETIPASSNLRMLCRERGLNGNHMRAVMHGRRAHHKNWVLA